MKTENLDNYELFYVELPPTDYLNDIEIHDEYEQTDYENFQGLSDEQVQGIAGDSLTAAKEEYHIDQISQRLPLGDQA